MSSGGFVAEAICDAGPLIHLSEIDQTSLLKQFKPLIIPELIRAEAVSFICPRDLPIQPASVDESKRSNLKSRLLMKLHPGEMDALALCAQRPNAIFLTDDLKARQEAKRLGISVHGSVGIIIRAFRFEIISKPQTERALRDLGNCRTLFITKAIIDEALNHLHQSVT
jgi:predicted nucleic acid-binding protein